MKIIKTKQLQKGFTLIEVLLVIVLIGILISIGLVTFNAEARFIDTRNDTRKTHIQTLESAITQYKLQEGDYPTGLSRNYQEICDPEATDCIGFFDLKQFLVPNYLQSIPQDPNDEDTTGGAGYSVAVDEATNTVSVRALQAEGGVIINTNDPLPTEPTTVSNTPLAATVPVTPPPPIVTNGLVLHLDAGDTASYPGTGTTWFDLSGNGRNGTLVNGVGYNSANGGSLVFDGVNDYVSGSITPLTGNYTIEIIFKLIIFNPGDNDLIALTSSNTHGFLGEIQSSDGKIRFLHRFPYGVSGGDSFYSSGSISLNQIYSISWVRDSNQKIYINGIFDSQITSTNSAFDSTLTQLTIGQITPNNSGRIINGNVYSTKIYNRALTPTEIQQNFNALRGRFGL